MRTYCNGCDYVVTPSESIRQMLLGLGVTKPVRPVPTGPTPPEGLVRNPEFPRKRFGIPEDADIFLYAGRIAREKNLEMLLDAFELVVPEEKRAHLLIVGDGPARPALLRDHPDVAFCGVQRGEALARHFASADLFVFPSRTETFGNVTLEAMASGVATVAFDRGAARETIADGVHGAAVAEGNEQAFIDACVRLAHEPVLRGGMAMAARQAVLRLRPEQVAAEFEHVLATLARDGTTDAAFARA
jgi:glycosyltransferase involved in cell wall biosynthesis